MASRIQDPVRTLAEAISLHDPESRPAVVQIDREDIRSPDHMANLGGRLFSRHLIAIEVAGTLLFVALVGAIAMVSRDSAEDDPSTGSQA